MAGDVAIKRKAIKPRGAEPGPPPRQSVLLRVALTDTMHLGPGKADLLEGIDATGSIAAAGRGMGMSYKRAWLLLETMNEVFAEPVVAATKGGRAGGGARLTDMGRAVLAAYRRMEAAAARGVAKEMPKLEKRMKPRGG